MYQRHIVKQGLCRDGGHMRKVGKTVDHSVQSSDMPRITQRHKSMTHISHFTSCNSLGKVGVWGKKKCPKCRNF